jgi:hypothetical protein
VKALAGRRDESDHRGEERGKAQDFEQFHGTPPRKQLVIQAHLPASGHRAGPNRMPKNLASRHV